MSTYWRFECTEHTPPLRSEDEFTQHTDDSAWKNALSLAGQRPLDIASSGNYFEGNAIRFLAQHPYCELAIVSEYGERRTGLRELRARGPLLREDS